MKRINLNHFANPFTIWAIIAAIAFAVCACASALTITRSTAERAALGDGLPAELKGELARMSDAIYTSLLAEDMYDGVSDERDVALAVAGGGKIINDAIGAGARVRLLTGDGSVLYDSNNSPLGFTYDGKCGDSDSYVPSANGTARILAGRDVELEYITAYYSNGGSAIEYDRYAIPARRAALISGDGAVEYYTLLYTGTPLGEDDADYAQYMGTSGASGGEYMLLAPTGRDSLLIFTFSLKNSSLMAHVSAERHILYDGVQQITLLLILAFLTGLAFIILLALWVFRDARARSARAALWGTLVILGNVIAFAIYLMVRPDKAE